MASQPPPSRALHGPGLMLLGYCFFGVVPVLVRLGTRGGVPSAEQAFFRFAIPGACILIVAALRLAPLRPTNWKALIARGILGGLAVSFWFYSLQHTTAARGTLLNYTHSIWTNLMAVVILRAAPPRGFWLLLGLASIGLWFVLDPSLDEINWGDAAGLISGFLGGAAVFSIKILRRTDNALTILASFCFFGIIFALMSDLLGLTGGDPGFGAWILPAGATGAAVLGMSFCSMIGQLSFSHAYGYTSLALGTMMSLIVPAIAAVGGWLALGESLTPRFIFGAALILAAIAWLGYQESRGANEPLAFKPKPDPAPAATPAAKG